MTDEQIQNELPASSEQLAHKEVKYRGFYALPSLFTLSSLFAAFYAVTSGFVGKYEVAAIAMFVSMVLDGLDGRVARLTHTQSEFGAQLDSIVDMVAFGAAPALVAFTWSLHEFGKVGWIISFIYAACAALRLARFNTQIGVVDKKYFIGLASPSAAALVAGTIWVATDLGLTGSSMVYLMAPITLAAGILMVTNVKYSSFKDVKGGSRLSLIGALAMAAGVAILSQYPSKVLLLLAVAYAISGPIMFLLKMQKQK